MVSINITFGESQVIKILENLELKMSKIQEVIDSLVAATTENTSVVAGAVSQIKVLTDKIQELLQAAADAPTLEETNALIAEAQEAVAIIEANSDALVAAVSANTPAEGIA